MKTEQPILITTINAGADLTKNLFVDFDGTLPSADVKALGVVNADTAQNYLAPIVVSGIALVKSAGAVTLGSAVTTDANGKAKAVTASEVINGYALDAATDVDQLIRILLK